MELTGSLQVGGTPMYMAPERWTTPDEVDARADIYAVGAVAYYLLAARPIFQPASDEELLYNIPSMDPKPLAEAASGEIPIELDRIVMRCLSKRPEDRPASVTELATALGGVSIENRWSELEAQRWWEIRASVRSERGGEPL